MISKEINQSEAGNFSSLQAAIEDFAKRVSGRESEPCLRTEIIHMLHQHVAQTFPTHIPLASLQASNSEAHERALKALARLFVECANISLEQALATKRRRLDECDRSVSE